MIEMIKKFNAYYFKEDYLIKYKIETTKDKKLEKMFDNLKPQAFELLEKNMAGQEKRFVETRIQDGLQKNAHEYEGVKIDMPYIDIQDDDELKKTCITNIYIGVVQWIQNFYLLHLHK
ncbi:MULTISPECIES: hypothetical protein [Acinetobacter]|uniref:Uncharacterized protein n=1 Tax=Acinetobacter piscicola TaxID=2006115 RepID=A0A7S7AIG5_9GAMM|nr:MULTISPECIES: hypothetical protein [Acinetobacter]QOW47031.1 hypothetical protein G0028_14695 [Acinetobacter piscicola]